MTTVRETAAPESDKAIRQRIFEVVLELCRERPYTEFTLSDIAAGAGVDEAELRAHRPAKNLLVMESLLHVVAPHMRFPNTGDIRADLRQQLAAVTRLFADPAIGPHLRAVIAEIHEDDRLAAAFLAKVYGPNRPVARARFEAAQLEGQLRADIDLDTAVDLVFGPIWFRLLLGTGPLEERLAEQIADHALAGLAVPTPERSADRLC